MHSKSSIFIFLVTSLILSTTGANITAPDITSCMIEASRITKRHFQYEIQALTEENKRLRDVDAKLDIIRKEISAIRAENEMNVFGSGQNCTISHRLLGDQLYAAGLHFDQNQRHVFARMQGQACSYRQWNIERYGVSRQYPVYKLRNVHFDEYLYGADVDFNVDAHRRRVFVSMDKGAKCDRNCFWDIQVVPEGRYNYFTIRNADLGEYLYTNDGGVYEYDANRRNVFTWHDTTEARENQRLHWKIECN